MTSSKLLINKITSSPIKMIPNNLAATLRDSVIIVNNVIITDSSLFRIWLISTTVHVRRRNCKYVLVSSLRANSVVPPPEENMH